jgi:hypothetical protein
MRDPQTSHSYIVASLVREAEFADVSVLFATGVLVPRCLSGGMWPSRRA